MGRGTLFAGPGIEPDVLPILFLWLSFSNALSALSVLLNHISMVVTTSFQ